MCSGRDGKTNALKVVRLKKARAVKFLENEHALLKRLDHPNIIVAKGTLLHLNKHIAMELEFVRGRDLCSLLTAAPDGMFISYDAFRHVTAQVFQAVAYLHSLQIYHKDLKPDNILVGAADFESIFSSTVVKLCDFGLAIAKGLTENRTSGGSPFWAAPELYSNNDTDGPASDLWSLGCIVYALATNGMPFHFTEAFLRAKGIAIDMDAFLAKMAEETRRYNCSQYGLLHHKEIRNIQRRFLRYEPSKRHSVASVLALPFFVCKAPSET